MLFSMYISTNDNKIDLASSRFEIENLTVSSRENI